MGTRQNRIIEAVLTSTHDLCFGAKVRKNVYPCKSQFYYIKVGCKGVFVTRICFCDEHARTKDIKCFYLPLDFQDSVWIPSHHRTHRQTEMYSKRRNC